jgi:Flp pilus assembly pilin Flp
VFADVLSILRSDEDQGLVEYALIIALVSIVASANNTLNSAAGKLS